ncbi:MAG: hypothetical protein F8N36_13555 [Desulfovibrio sp.]|uniref:hypothetical protein n=1 Tax=Desulfovibrio sp. TaxID=885 RepID=UPI00135DE195|nr:hypothetical protein [Desulfovibrio sp.]MTJ93865.1 hypothetical protein [Desulfovibrio sp.]
MPDGTAELEPRKQNRSAEELEMRALVAAELRKQYPAARIVHEMPLRYSTNRLDLAAITPSQIVAVEIKSSKDVLSRLEAQLRAFGPVCSKIIVALAPCWNEALPHIEEEHPPKTARDGQILSPGWKSYRQQYTEAQATIRDARQRFSWIETWTADAATGAIAVTEAGYRENPWPWHGEMLHILRVSELREIAEQYGIASRTVHKELVMACCQNMTGQQIIAAVCRSLRLREGFAAGSDMPVA